MYSTYLGGKALDSVNAIAVDSNGNAYAAGNTTSPDFPITSGAFQPDIGYSFYDYPQQNAFVTELNSAGSSLFYSTFLGGGISLGALADMGDGANGIAVDGQGMVYVTGMACTGDFPTTAGAFEPQNLDGEIDAECTAFLTKMNPAPNMPLLYSTFFGGTGDGDAGDDFYGEGANALAISPAAQCTTIAEALAAFSNLAPNLVLLDYDLGEEQGFALLVEIRNRQYDAKVLMVTAGMSQVAAVSALDAGALGIFLKHSSHEQLLSAIHRIAAGETWIDPLALRTLVSGRQPSAKNREGARALTIRQKEVMRGILDGFTNKEIGLSLKMSESSIKAVIQELFQKAGVRTRSQLVRIVIEKHSADWLKLDVEG